MENEQESLIIGYLQGRLRGKELDEFYAWVADPAHKRLYFETKTVYDACKPLPSAERMEEGWRRLLSDRRRERSSFRIYLRRISTYAAVALVATAVTSLLFLDREERPASPVARYIGGDGLAADRIVLADGTEVSLGSRTTFTYDEHYGARDRVVHLDGEAYFNVAKVAGKPFIVKTKGQQIEALGTKFNVSAYPTDSLLTTTLLEGSVRLTSDSLKGETILSPNEQLIYNRNRHTAAKKQVDADLFVSWTTGYYYFPDQTLQAILYRLGHLYGATFTIRSEALSRRHFTGTFYRGQSLKEIMEIISLSMPLRYRIDERHITIEQI